jgi:hypothetical protein
LVKVERAKIIDMIDRGTIPEGTDLAEIKNLCASYPYCSTFRLLLALGSKETDDLALPEAINLASLFVQDRSKLYEFAVRDGLRKRLEQEETAEPPEEATVLEKAGEVAHEGDRDSRTEEDTLVLHNQWMRFTNALMMIRANFESSLQRGPCKHVFLP